MTDTHHSPYPDSEFPWDFYFNGILMPKWGACWGLAQITRFLEPEKDWDNDVGHRDVYLISCRLDHVGVPESADPNLFLYAVREALIILLEQRNPVMDSLRDRPGPLDAEEIYQGLVSAALEMRCLAGEQRIAFWTLGYEADRLRLVERMELARLPESDPRHEPPPHLRRIAGEVESLIGNQRSRLHGLAQSGRFDKTLRKELHAI